VITSPSLMTSSEALPDRPFESIVRTDARRLYWLALSILDDGGEAEDAVQETFLKAWRSWDSVSQIDRPEAWLTRVCVNHCINRRRLLRSRRWTPFDLAGGTAASPGWGTDAESIDMDRAYRRLSGKQRAAITLNYDYGYSVEECAVFMGCRPGTVRTHLKRGLANLRKELKDD
jgi:RNA polymerase sigma factor (sigma-70 family)